MIANRKTLTANADKSVQVIEYPNGDIRVSIIKRGRFTAERVIFDDKGGNIMLRSDKRANSRE